MVFCLHLILFLLVSKTLNHLQSFSYFALVIFIFMLIKAKKKNFSQHLHPVDLGRKQVQVIIPPPSMHTQSFFVFQVLYIILDNIAKYYFVSSSYICPKEILQDLLWFIQVYVWLILNILLREKLFLLPTVSNKSNLFSLILTVMNTNIYILPTEPWRVLDVVLGDFICMFGWNFHLSGDWQHFKCFFKVVARYFSVRL